MAITSIKRDWGTGPAIVRITSSDNYAAITASGYIDAQLANIQAVNFGDFEWLLSDTVLCWYQDAFGVGAWASFSISSDFASLLPLSVSASASVSLTAAQVLAAYATPQLIVPAPGVGRGLIVIAANVVTEVSTAFGGGGAAIIEYGAVANGAGSNSLSATIPAAQINAASSQVYSMAPFAATTVTATSVVTNKGVYFSNATGAFTGGAGSTITINLSYMNIAAV